MAQNTVTLIVPTAINFLTMVNDAILTNVRNGFSATLSVPSLRSRARLITKEIGVIPVADTQTNANLSFTR